MISSLKIYTALFCLPLLVYSCRKDVGEAVDDTNRSFAGTYDCMEVTRSVVFIDSNRTSVRIDTSRHVMIDLIWKPNGSFDVRIRNYFVFNTGKSSTKSYNPDCSSGPCPVLRLYVSDSLYLSRKNSNVSSSYYYGKKQK